MTIANAQLIGVSTYEAREGTSGSKTLHFLYKAGFIEGTGTISFTVFGNDHAVEVDSLALNSNYRLVYYRDKGKGYNHLLDVQPAGK